MIFDQLFARFPSLESCREAIMTTDAMIKACYDGGGKLLICGNGGSCADAQHIVGELMKGFLKKRPLDSETKSQMRQRAEISEDLLCSLQQGLPAIALTDALALTTAFNNDVNADYTFAQQTYTLGRPGDLLVGISTSGNAKNVANAVNTARAMGLKTLGLTGLGGGFLKASCDCCICVPERETFLIQELHLPVYHALCASVEEYYFAQ